MKYLYFVFFISFVTHTTFFSQELSPFEIGNTWIYSEGEWSGQGSGSRDTLKYQIVNDTLMQNGKRYFRSSRTHWLFRDFVRSDSNGVFYYDTLNNKEWLFYRYDLNIGEYQKVCYDSICDDSTYYPKVIKYADTSIVFLGEKVRSMHFYYDTGLDDSYFATIIPKFGYAGFSSSDMFSNYNLNLIGCKLYGEEYGYLTSVDENIFIVNEYSLFQNYPNPFNPKTIIQYYLPEASNVSLKVYDVLGKEVATLVDQQKSSGTHRIEFNGSHLSSGIYFYKLTTGKFTDIKKMLLLR